MIDYIKEEEKRNPHLYEMCDREDPHEMMTAHIHYVLECWDEGQPEDVKQWLTDLRKHYGT